MTSTRLRGFAAVLLILLPAMPARAQFIQESPAFRFNTNAFWLNLHNFLYVLGRAHSNAGNANASAIAGALPDEERGLASLNPEDVATWKRSVDVYGNGFSSLDATLDDSLISATYDLASAGDSPTLGSTTRIDGATRNALESAAGLYRRAFWPIHSSMNRRFETGLAGLMKVHQRAVISQLTRRYGASWPASRVTIHLSPYTNEYGIYTLPGAMILMSSAAPQMTGSAALEAAFAEGMHQWDAAMSRRLATASATKKVPVDEWLLLGLLHYTAGDAVKRAIPTHVPNATRFNLWLGHDRIRQALDAAWLPWLNGTGYSDDALNALVARAAAAPAPTPRPAARPRRKR
jgi:hypothetical protein